MTAPAVRPSPRSPWARPSVVPSPLVFAHRGGAALGPENTFAAFDRAVALGVDGLELDVRLSRDGEVVVHHDRTLRRTAGRPDAVARLTAGELATVDVGRHFPGVSSGPPATGVPRLRDVLARYPSLLLIVELKVNDARLARAVVEDVAAADAVDRVCVGGFQGGVLRAVRATDPRVATSAGREEVRWLLYRSWIGWTPRRAAYCALQVPEMAGRTRVVSPRFLALAHRAGLTVHVWTVDRPDDVTRLAAMGVDGIITDRPDVALSVLGRSRVPGEGA